MRLGEWTRQTRWAHSPSPAPEAAGPGGIYVREFVWAICPACDLQVHGTLADAQTEGLRCPECGGSLSPPLSGGGPGTTSRIAAEEARFTRSLQENER